MLYCSQRSYFHQWSLYITLTIRGHCRTEMLEVRLLGKFEVRLDGDRIEIPSRPAQTLLAYLILHAGTQQRHEKLAGLLWPDSTESNARRNLRTALWRLRTAIG